MERTAHRCMLLLYVEVQYKRRFLCLEKHCFFGCTIPLSNGEKYSLNTAALDCNDGFITACHNDEMTHGMV